VSLWRLYRGSPVSPSLPHSASSAPGLSQPCDGLLLHTVSLSCFIQAPPIGFKEHERRCAVLCVLNAVRPKISQFQNAKLERALNRSRWRGSVVDSAARPAPQATPGLLPYTSMCHSPRCFANDSSREEGTPTRQMALTLPVKSRLLPPHRRPTRRPKNATNEQIRKSTRLSVLVTTFALPASVAKTIRPRDRPRCTCIPHGTLKPCETHAPFRSRTPEGVRSLPGA
jgi:hypothetical protein